MKCNNKTKQEQIQRRANQMKHEMVFIFQLLQRNTRKIVSEVKNLDSFNLHFVKNNRKLKSHCKNHSNNAQKRKTFEHRAQKSLRKFRHIWNFSFNSSEVRNVYVLRIWRKQKIFGHLICHFLICEF